MQRAFEAGLKVAQATVQQPSSEGLAQVRKAPAPNYAPALRERGGEALFRGDNLPQANGIKPEYANSGRWIGKPES